MVNKINSFISIFPGFCLVLVVSLLSLLLSEFIFVGSIALSIILGVLVNNFFTLSKRLDAGINFSEKYLLNIAIIFMGVNFNTYTINQINYITLLNVLFFVFIGFFATFFISRLFNISFDLSCLLGFGNAICGSSAIISASSILNSKKENILLSISTINIIGSLSIFLLPSLFYLFAIDDSFYQGLIIGGSVQAVGQVSATGYILSDSAGQTAVLIKMCRILFLFPALLFLIIINSFKKNKSNFQFPYFILGFAFIFILNYHNLIPFNLVETFKFISRYFLLFSMAALGLKVNSNIFLKQGAKVFFITFIAFLIQVFTIIQIVT